MEQDYIDLFTHKKKSHMAKYVHKYRPDIYEKILKQESYYPFKMESELLIEISQEICKNLSGVKEVLEIGPGSHTAIVSKTIPFLTKLKSQTHFLTYRAIDSTLEYADHACKIVANHLRDVKTQAIEVDFLRPKALEKIKEYKQEGKKLIFGFGQPIFANNHNDDINTLLESIRCFLREEDYFLFGIDTNRNEELLGKAYNTEITHELLLNVMHHLKVTLNLEKFDPEAFDFVYKWNSEEKTIELALKATIQQNLKIKEKELVIHKDEEFNILNSKKSTIEEIEFLLKKQKMRLQKIISLDNNRQNKFSIVIAKKEILDDSS